MIELEASPRPIPILVGDPQPNEPVQLVLRVIERGHSDIQVSRVLGSRWTEELTYALDHAIREARQYVGVRHGTWICHVVPFDRYARYGAYTPNGDFHLPVPPIAPRLRHREPREWRTVTYEGRIDVDQQLLERTTGRPF